MKRKPGSLGVQRHHARHAVRIVVGMRHDDRQAEPVGLGRVRHGLSLPFVPLASRPRTRRTLDDAVTTHDREQGGHS